MEVGRNLAIAEQIVLYLIVSNIEHSQAFLIEEYYHYYCLRRFRLTKDYFFKTDSKYPIYHQPIHCEQITQFLRTLFQHQSNVYVIIEHIQDDINELLSVNNIQSKLWSLPDTPADLEHLVVFSHHE